MTTTTIRKNVLDRHMIDTSATSSVDQALTLAGMNFTVSKHEVESVVYMNDGFFIIKYPEDRGVVASWPDGSMRAFRTVGKGYGVIQNSEAFGPVDALMQEGFIKNIAQVGALNDGQRVFMLAELTSESTLTDDPHKRMLMLQTTHDGTGSLVVRSWQHRLACSNQISGLFWRKQEGVIARIPHTVTAQQRVRFLLDSIQSSIKVMDEYDDAMRRLMSSPVDDQTTRVFAGMMIPDAPKDATERQRQAVTRKRETIRNLAMFAKTQDNVRGTAAAMFHAAVEYSDYYAGGDRAARLLRGSDNTFKAEAYDLAVTLSK